MSVACHFRMTISIFYLILLANNFNMVLSAKIIFIWPISISASHKMVFDPLIHELASRGHQLTVLSPVKSPPASLPVNVREIVPIPLDDFSKTLGVSPYELRRRGKARSILMQGHVWRNECEQVYSNAEVQQLIANGPQFDLIIINGFFQQCLLGLVHVLHAPFIYLTSMPSSLFLTRYTGNYFPTSFVPLPFLDLSDSMDFSERLYNLVLSYLANFMHDLASVEHEKIYRKYLGSQIPDSFTIGSNVSLILSNEHFGLTFPRPNLPDTVSIGGIHCRPAEPLPVELDQFLSGAEHGFIYFSLGSIIRPSYLLEDQRQIFINVFRKLKQRVIWKWENESMTDLPANVLVKSWLPQQDILGHPNIKLFITHGGLLSTQEAVYHGVPLIGIPIFVDQDLNMNHAQAQGYALTLEILELRETDFENAITRILSDNRFSEKVKELSEIFRHQERSALERATFWSEYVIRHKGAQHLRSAARNLNVFQIHSLDIVGFLLIVLLLFIYLTKIVVTRIIIKPLARIFERLLRNYFIRRMRKDKQN